MSSHICMQVSVYAISVHPSASARTIFGCYGSKPQRGITLSQPTHPTSASKNIYTHTYIHTLGVKRVLFSHKYVYGVSARPSAFKHCIFDHSQRVVRSVLHRTRHDPTSHTTTHSHACNTNDDNCKTSIPHIVSRSLHHASSVVLFSMQRKKQRVGDKTDAHASSKLMTLSLHETTQLTKHEDHVGMQMQLPHAYNGSQFLAFEN